MCQHVVGEWLGNPTYLPSFTTPPPQQHHHNPTTASLLDPEPSPPSQFPDGRTPHAPLPPTTRCAIRITATAMHPGMGKSELMDVCMARFGSVPCTYMYTARTENPTIHLPIHPRARATQVIYFHHPSHPHCIDGNLPGRGLGCVRWGWYLIDGDDGLMGDAMDRKHDCPGYPVLSYIIYHI
jgi:hypothetical protein